ncbi:G-protein coupled receptor 35 [Trachemys scripta elegans]|uniref:G-protein coupled receptor 35 n=1 Tax=Trachemys scripta elegans TaxID=31138 RepID=UPI001556F38B|nr:G-protein coupled receptor 35 [Trachemys scripta elegans]XP_034637690.1 G-protein coupled receptor 35 [Trachemys scripta elegans]
MTNSTNCNNSLSYNVRLIQVIIYATIFPFGATFNVLALWVFCCKLKKWTETRVYMINLVIADCSVVCSLPFQIYFFWNDWHRDTLCLTIQSIYLINMSMSIYIITVISVDRYIAIKYPLKAKSLRSPWKAALICGLLWVSTIIGLNIEHRREETLCFQKVSTKPSTSVLFFLIFFFLIPLIILSFCSMHIIRSLKKRMITNPHENKLIEKAIYIVSANMIVFILCFSPVQIGMLARFVMEKNGVNCLAIQKIRIFINVAACIANSNCCMDAICYYFVAKEFQEASSFCKPKSHHSKTNETHTSQLRIF